MHESLIFQTISKMGKTSEGPPEVSFSDENSCTMRKKVAYVLAFLAVASCVVTGLLVYYVGVMGITCVIEPHNLGSEANGQTQKTVKEKVRLHFCHLGFGLNCFWAQFQS